MHHRDQEMTSYSNMNTKHVGTTVQLIKGNDSKGDCAQVEMTWFAVGN